MAKNINVNYDTDEFKRLKRLKEAIGGSWEQVIAEGIETLAEREGIEVEADA